MKKKIWNIVRIVIIIILLGVIGYCGYMIISTQLDYKESADYFEGLQSEVNLVELPDNPKEEEVKEEDLGIDIDFDALRKKNNDINSWIYCRDTVINYPVVQGDDNVYYLKHLMNGKYSNSGTLFLDARNASDYSDPNSFIYGHNMRNKTMFACLTGYANQKYYEQHPYLYLITPDKVYYIEVFSAYKTAGDDAKTYKFVSEQGCADYFKYLKGRSDFSCDVEFAEGDKILTLSTCEYSRKQGRYVVSGLLRELNYTPTGINIK